MTNYFTSKNGDRTLELFSKLLASEDITIQHSPTTQTAYFEIEKRNLVLPVWENITDYLYCLFVGHEVGHALFTPRNYYEIVKDTSDKFRYALNVVEDVRVDRLVKTKYPGLKKDYIEGFKDLYQRDFFGLKNRNVKDLDFLDRLNIYFKMKDSTLELFVPFSEEELEFVKLIDNCVSFESAVAIARKLVSAEEKKKQVPEQSTINPEKYNRGASNSDLEDSEEIDNENSEEEFEEESENSDDEESEEIENTESDDVFSEEDTPTDMTLEEKLQEEIRKTFVSKNPYAHSNEIVYCDLPTRDLSCVITDYKTVSKQLRSHYNRYLSVYSGFGDDAEYQKVNSETRNTVNYLIKEFEMKKSALINAKTQSVKTGVLDMNKLYSYKFEENLFKRNMLSDRGKSHGVIILFDFSSSMVSRIIQTYEQILNLVFFCRKEKIPFEVFGFTSQKFIYTQSAPPANPNEVLCKKGDLTIRQYFSSTMTNSEFSTAVENMSRLIHSYRLGRAYVPSEEYMGGTPLAKSLVVMNQVIGKFKTKNDLDIVNLIVISDGGDNEGLPTTKNPYLRCNPTVVIRDIINKKSAKLGTVSSKKSICEGVLKIIQDNYACNLICFYLINGISDLRYIIQNTKVTDLKDYKQKGFIATKQNGYDQYFIVDSKKGFSISNETFDSVSGNSEAKIRSSMQKILNKKLTSRLLLRKFIETIA